MINLAEYRLVDLSKTLTPGKVFGSLHDKRRLEIRQFIFPPGELMHQIDMESHIGTHLEVPSHFIPALYHQPAKDLSQIPLESLIGQAVYVDISSLEMGTPITVQHLEKENINRGEILLVGNGPYTGGYVKKRNYFPSETAEWMAHKPIKMLGLDDSISLEDPKVVGRNLELYKTHNALLGNDIPFIECLTNLSSLK
ncbi:cyclase family protein, partial [[Eubacterium] cellulosolvens]